MSHFRSVNDYTTPRTLRKALISPSSFEENQEESTLNKAASLNSCDFGCTPTEPTSLDESWDWVLTNYDVGTTQPQSIRQELKRLEVLKSYLILDSEREAEFDRLTTMASRVFQVPIALVSLIDLGRQWFMSSHGLGDLKETSRDVAFCSHAIQGRHDVLIVKDALQDPRFCDMPAVAGPPHVRFYAGTPLMSPEGYKLGTFCIVDTKPWPQGMSKDDQANLMDFAAMAMKAMVHRRNMMKKGSCNQFVAATAHDFLTPIMGIQLSLSVLQEDAASLSETQRATLSRAVLGGDYLNRMSQTTMNTLRKGASQASESAREDANSRSLASLAASSRMGTALISMKDFLADLKETMRSIRKRVPLIITVDDSVPDRVISDDLKLLRSSLNLLSNAFTRAKTGSVQFHISTKNNDVSLSDEDGNKQGGHRSVVFECTDSGEDLLSDEEETHFMFSSTSGNLGLYSVAQQIGSLGGSYGSRSRHDDRLGAVFWFCIPILRRPRDLLATERQRCCGEVLAATTAPSSCQLDKLNVNKQRSRRTSPASIAELGASI